MIKIAETFLEKPMFTRRCDHPRCDEIIYRDTIDKDDAWLTTTLPRKFFCSEEHARQAEHVPIYRSMIVAGKHFDYDTVIRDNRQAKELTDRLMGGE